MEMDSNTEIFADGVGEITLAGGMVRMDLVSLVGSQRDKEDPPKMRFKARVIMPPDGFLRSFAAMESLVQQLVKAGLVKRREDGVTTETSGIGDRTLPPEPPKSPNFRNS
jgi:hypothetical protein